MKSSIDTCLVTGGAGFIGCALSSQLTRRFPRVVVLDNLHPQIHSVASRPDALDAEVEFVLGDVTDPLAWDRLLCDFSPNVVIHLAAETGTGQSLAESTRHAMVNVVGTTQMLDGLTRHGRVPAKIILTSSRAVYGEGRWTSRADGSDCYPGQRSIEQLKSGQWDFPRLVAAPFSAATTKPAPTSIYGGTKLAQEHLLGAWALARGASLRTLRLQNVYGPGQSLSNPYTGIVSLFARLAKAGLSIPLYEDGKMTRDFIFIEDVVAALLAAIDDPVGNFTLDVGTGGSTSIREVSEFIATRYDAPAPHVCGKYRHGDVRHAACDIHDTVSRLPWAPQFAWQSGLEVLCRWIDAQPSAQGGVQ